MFSKSIPIGFILSSTIVLAAVDFNRDVRPILASKCYACHGPDEESRKAKLRLDVREQALKKEAFVPGKIKESELHYRIHSDDPDEIMPPPNSHEPMSA
ncbi:MAG: c-type cytochrome domain-containing protein, partial [Opitutae bacterium]